MKFGLLTTLSKKISRRYARAFFNQALEKKTLEDVHADVRQLLAMLKTSPELRDFIQDPNLPSERLTTVFKELMQGKIQPMTLEFLIFLNQKNRLNILNEILTAFHEFYNQYHGIKKIQIISAALLDNEQVAAICAKLKKRWNRDVFAETTVDPDLVGGFQIKSGDEVLDFSMKHLLENYRRQVINA